MHEHKSSVPNRGHCNFVFKSIAFYRTGEFGFDEKCTSIYHESRVLGLAIPSCLRFGSLPPNNFSISGPPSSGKPLTCISLGAYLRSEEIDRPAGCVDAFRRKGPCTDPGKDSRSHCRHEGRFAAEVKQGNRR